MTSSTSGPIQNVSGCRLPCGCGCGVWVIIILAALAAFVFFALDEIGLNLNIGQPSVIEIGSTVTGENSFFGVSRWTFEGQAGEGVTIALNRAEGEDDYDPLVRLISPDGTELISDDDGGDSLNSLIECYALPVSGAYVIQVDGFSGDTGNYELTLSATELKVPRTLEYGDEVVDSLNQCQQTFVFNGAANDVVWVSITNSDFDATLQLLGEDGLEIASDDDSFGRDPALQGIVLPEGGQYRIILRPYFEGDTGDYALTLSEGE